jgi:hypothetical protein
VNIDRVVEIFLAQTKLLYCLKEIEATRIQSSNAKAHFHSLWTTTPSYRVVMEFTTRGLGHDCILKTGRHRAKPWYVGKQPCVGLNETGDSRHSPTGDKPLSWVIRIPKRNSPNLGPGLLNNPENLPPVDSKAATAEGWNRKLHGLLIMGSGSPYLVVEIPVKPICLLVLLP